jgi:peptidoglycan/LPS O-acetylase OafA/YrhL
MESSMLAVAPEVAAQPHPPKRQRTVELDVLRGFAILLVMGAHVQAYPIWSTFGGFGVDLFFVLSGFLISNLLFKEYLQSSRIVLSRFFLRRALKLYPSFYLLLAGTLVYCLVWQVPVTRRAVLGELTLTQNYVGGIWGHTWSLAVEEHFYLLLPIALFLMMKLRPGADNPFRPVPYVFLAVASCCLALRIWNGAHYRAFDHHTHYEPSHLRFDSLLFGVFLSYLHNFRSHVLSRIMSPPWRLPVSFLGILALAPMLILDFSNPFVYTYGFTLLYIGFGILLLLAIYKEKPGAKPGPVVRAIGAIGVYSYTVYLWHVPLAMVFTALAVRFSMVNQYALHAIYLATSIAVGIAVSKLVEIPVLKMRERIFPSRAYGITSSSAVE